MKAEMEVLHPGLFTSIQDMGRCGFMKYGIPVSGAMDIYSAKMANLILQNSEESAVLEITQLGPKLKFSEPSQIAITGADLSPMINSIRIKNSSVFTISQGDVLSFGKRIKGCRCYLAISGGFKSEEKFGSRSWYDGVTEYFRLEKGMKLPYNSSLSSQHRRFSALKVRDEYLVDKELSVYPGPEFNYLPYKVQKTLTDLQFTIDNLNNRMGIQLKEIVDNRLEPIITGPVVPGTVQLTPGGKLIILMKDCQTTGGYPRALQLTSRAINILAQKVPGDKINFKLEENKEIFLKAH